MTQSTASLMELLTDDISRNPYKQDFPLLANNPQLAFLDSAATEQRPAAVIEAQKRFYETIFALGPIAAFICSSVIVPSLSGRR